MDMDIRPLGAKLDYDWALAEIAPYFTDPPPIGSAAAERFDVLAALIELYEARHWPIEAPDPVDAIRCTDGNVGLFPSRSSKTAGFPVARIRNTCQTPRIDDGASLSLAPRVADTGGGVDPAGSKDHGGVAD